jgi:hypothetical protein
MAASSSAFTLNGANNPSSTPQLSIDEKQLFNTVKKVNIKLDMLSKEVKLNMFAIMRTEWGNLAGDLVAITPPFDKGGSLGKGRQAAKETIKAAFVPLSSIPIGALIRAKNWRAVDAYGWKPKSSKVQKLLDKRNWNALDNLKFGITKPNPAAAGAEPISKITNAHHRTVRDPRTGKWNGTRYYVAGANAQAKINKFAAEVSQNVGFMLSGWVYCHNALKGNRKVPSVKNYGTGKVVVKPFKGGGSASVTIINSKGNFNGWLGNKKGAEYQALISKAQKRIQEEFDKAAIGMVNELDFKS